LLLFHKDIIKSIPHHFFVMNAILRVDALYKQCFKHPPIQYFMPLQLKIEMFKLVVYTESKIQIYVCLMKNYRSSVKH